jgi:hypothetical protein
MKQRQRRQQPLAFLQSEQRGGVRGPPEVLRLRTADAFRRARRAGGVEDRDRVAGARGGRQRGLARRGKRRDLETRRVRRLAADQPKFSERRARGGGDQVGCAVRIGDGEPGAAIHQDMFELGAARGDVDWGRDRAHPRAAEIGSQDRRSVAAHQRDAVAGFDASLCEPRGHPTGDAQRLGESPNRVAGSENRALRRARGASRQHRGQRAFRRRNALRECGERRVGIVRKQRLPWVRKRTAPS